MSLLVDLYELFVDRGTPEKKARPAAAVPADGRRLGGGRSDWEGPQHVILLLDECTGDTWSWTGIGWRQRQYGLVSERFGIEAVVVVDCAE